MLGAPVLMEIPTGCLLLLLRVLLVTISAVVLFLSLERNAFEGELQLFVKRFSACHDVFCSYLITLQK